MPKQKAPPCTKAKRIGNLIVFECQDSKIKKGVIKIHQGGDRSRRNNNPGNIEYKKHAKEHGAIGTDGRFAIFPDMKTGEEAHKKLLQRKDYQRSSIRETMYSYAPKHENNTEAYIKFLEKATGKSADSKLKDLTSGQFDKLLKGIRRYEGTKPPKTLFVPKDMASYMENVASGKASPKPKKESPARIKEMFKRASRSAIKHHSGGTHSGETLKRDGGKVYRIEEDGATRGYFVSE